MTNASSNGPKNYRAAIVGAGLMGTWHAAAVHHIGGCVSAVVDRDAHRTAQFVRKWPRAHTARDLAEIVKNDLADIIHICTPAASHEALTQEALESSRHVLVEKPLTETPESTARLLELADAKSLLLCPVHQMIFQPGVLRVQEAVEKIGPVLHVDALICSAGAEHNSESSDLAVADILPGPLSVVARFAPSAIGKLRWSVHHSAKGELRATASVEKATVSVLISMDGRPTINSLRLIGERGTAYADLFHGFGIVEQGAVSRARKVMHPFTQSGKMFYSATANLLIRASRRESAYPGLRELIRRFYHSVRTGSPAPISAAETLDVALARRNILEEMWSGSPIVSGR